MSHHDTLTQALEQIAMAAEATVCNPAWIAQHARAALAKAQAPQAHALDRDAIIDLISPLSRNTADHDIDFAFRVLDAAQAQQPPYAWAVSGASTMFFGPTAEYDARQEAKHCGGTAEAFPLFKEAQAAQGEPLVRFCPGCGSVGEVPDSFKDCCPDGGHARMIPESLARRCHDLFRLALDSAVEAQAQPAPVVPEGWKLVPVEPTKEMLASVAWPECAKTDWNHMLTASPTPPAQEGEKA